MRGRPPPSSVPGVDAVLVAGDDVISWRFLCDSLAPAPGETGVGRRRVDAGCSLRGPRREVHAGLVCTSPCPRAIDLPVPSVLLLQPALGGDVEAGPRPPRPGNRLLGAVAGPRSGLPRVAPWNLRPGNPPILLFVLPPGVVEDASSTASCRVPQAVASSLALPRAPVGSPALFACTSAASRRARQPRANARPRWCISAGPPGFPSRPQAPPWRRCASPGRDVGTAPVPGHVDVRWVAPFARPLGPPVSVSSLTTCSAPTVEASLGAGVTAGSHSRGGRCRMGCSRHPEPLGPPSRVCDGIMAAGPPLVQRPHGLPRRVGPPGTCVRRQYGANTPGVMIGCPRAARGGRLDQALRGGSGDQVARGPADSSLPHAANAWPGTTGARAGGRSRQSPPPEPTARADSTRSRPRPRADCTSAP
jgi:hypothetical protein